MILKWRINGCQKDVNIQILTVFHVKNVLKDTKCHMNNVVYMNVANMNFVVIVAKEFTRRIKYTYDYCFVRGASGSGKSTIENELATHHGFEKIIL